jgi:hypothetical protein
MTFWSTIGENWAVPIFVWRGGSVGRRSWPWRWSSAGERGHQAILDQREHLPPLKAIHEHITVSNMLAGVGSHEQEVVGVICAIVSTDLPSLPHYHYSNYIY